MTNTTLHYRYRAPSRLKGALARAGKGTLAAPNVLLGSHRTAVRIISRLCVLAIVSAGLVRGLYWTATDYMMQGPINDFKQGKVLSHVYPTWEVIALVIAMAAAVTASVFALYGLSKLSDRRLPNANYRHRPDSGESTIVTASIVLVVAVFFTFISSFTHHHELSKTETAPLFFTTPQTLHFSASSDTAARMAAKLHLQPGTCTVYNLSVDYEDHDTTACRTDKELTLTNGKVDSKAKAKANATETSAK